jgi:3-methylcrotonyl-CoA carboxylase alpha subunit
VQRRHQKIIEEAPAPGLDPAVRSAMAQAAMTAARAVGYVGAGTVEFLVDPEQNFYFMEMNTRLQVEHPVTELITGIDLVEWQLNVARGERLPAGADRIQARGAAVEARLYAEDPAHDYLPSVGHIAHLEWPDLGPHLRLDTGVDAGDEVSAYYDPMLGKVIAWGESRSQACDLLLQGLGKLEIAGVATNRALLMSILADPVFQRGGVGTDFLPVRRGELQFGERATAPEDYLIAALWYAAAEPGLGSLWSNTAGWRLGAAALTRWRFGDADVRIETKSPDAFRGRVAGRDYELRQIRRTDSLLEVEVDGRMERAKVAACDGRLELFRAGGHVSLRAARTEDALQGSAESDSSSLVTPLPGTVVAVHVTLGQSVSRGAPLITLEAMKMEHTVAAPYAGVVERLPFALGDRVAAGSVLVELKAQPVP